MWHSSAANFQSHILINKHMTYRFRLIHSTFYIEFSYVVLSDMAANTTGHRQTDHIRTTHLLEIALDFSIENLNRNGVFLAKCFKGGTEKEALDLMQKNFSKVHHVKPDASRKESVEGYVIALGFKGK